LFQGTTTKKPKPSSPFPASSRFMAFSPGMTLPPIRGFFAFRAKNRPVEASTPAGTTLFRHAHENEEKTLHENCFLSGIDAPSR
jgi:hypothetical protein